MNLLADTVSLADIDWQFTLFALFGGLGIFLYGINLMGDSLKAMAGSKMKIIIEKSTNTPLKGIFIGFIITALIQSSSGTTAITVGLVRAGLMTLPQAIGIILGANIGTTVTSLLASFKIKEFALPIMAFGSFLIFFVNKKKAKQLGGVFLGFGMLFFGLDIMGSELKVLAKLPEFVEILLQTKNIPVLGVLVGAVATAIVQSSSATTVILQELYLSGGIPLKGAMAVLLGANIGTTVTAILASIGGSVAARRAAMGHVVFNVAGSLLFLIFITPYTGLISLIEENFFEPNSAKAIFFGHLIFNVINTVIFFFLIKQLVWLVKKLVPGNDQEVSYEYGTLDNKLVSESPVLALEAAKNVVLNMGRITSEMFDLTVRYSFENNHKLFDNGMAIEEVLDTIDKKTHDYLVSIAQAGLDNKSSQLQAEYVDTIRDFERIGDHCTNILQFFEMRYEDKVVLSEPATKELQKLYDVVVENMKYTLEAFKSNDNEVAKKVFEREAIIDKLVIKNRKRHIRRLNNKESSETQDELYVDILSNIERIGDHCNNIAINVVQDSYYNEELDFED